MGKEHGLAKLYFLCFSGDITTEGYCEDPKELAGELLDDFPPDKYDHKNTTAYLVRFNSEDSWTEKILVCERENDCSDACKLLEEETIEDAKDEYEDFCMEDLYPEYCKEKGETNCDFNPDLEYEFYQEVNNPKSPWYKKYKECIQKYLEEDEIEVTCDGPYTLEDIIETLQEGQYP